MKSISESFTSNFRIAILVVAIIGIGYSATTVIALGLDTKWTLTIVLLIICFSTFPLIKEKHKFALFFIVITLPIGLDFHFIHFPSLPYRLPINGLRITLFELIFFTLFIIWIFNLIRHNDLSVQFFPSFSVPYFGILILFLMSSINSPLPFEIKLAYIWYASINFLVFLFFANNVKDEEIISLIVKAMIVSGVIQSLLAIGQFITGSTFGIEIIGESEKGHWAMKSGAGLVHRVSGTVGHPNRLSSFLGWVLPLSIAMIFTAKKKRFYVLHFFSFAIVLIANILTFSRGGWISSFVSGTICCYWCLSKKFRIRFLSGLFVIAASCIFIASLIIFVNPVKQRLFGYDYGSFATRFPLAQVALSMITQSPFLGVGPGSYNAVSKQYDTTEVAISYIFPAPVHNEFLLIASEIGIPALILFLTIILFTLIRLLQTARQSSQKKITYVAIGFFCSWIGWCLHRMIAYDYSLLYHYAFLAIGTIYAMHCCNKSKN
jgi:O-antigen ligase